jgi:hypothetical protein
MARQAVPRPSARYEAHLGTARRHAALFLAQPGRCPSITVTVTLGAIIRKSWLPVVQFFFFFASGSANFLRGWLLMTSATSRSGFDHINTAVLLGGLSLKMVSIFRGGLF